MVVADVDTTLCRATRKRRRHAYSTQRRFEGSGRFSVRTVSRFFLQAEQRAHVLNVAGGARAYGRVRGAWRQRRRLELRRLTLSRRWRFARLCMDAADSCFDGYTISRTRVTPIQHRLTTPGTPAPERFSRTAVVCCLSLPNIWA